MNKRLRAINGLIFALATLSITVALVVLGDRFPARLDTSATGVHKLSPRVGALLASIDEQDADPAELVIVYDSSRRDPRMLDRVRDTLQAADNKSDAIGLTEIDVAKARGFERVAELLERVREREAPRIASADTSIRETCATLTAVAETLRSLSDPLQQAAQSGPAGDQSTAILARYAVLARSLARELGDLVTMTTQQLDADSPDHALIASQLLRSRAPLEEQLLGLARTIEATNQPALTELSRTARSLRDNVAVSCDRLSRIEMPRIRPVLEAIESREALLLIPPESPASATAGTDEHAIAAAPIDELFPALIDADTGGLAAHAEAARRTEELLSALLLRVTRSDRPIVVLVHAQWESIADARPLLGGLRSRLARAGIDMVDWPAARDPAPPTFETLFENPSESGTRPVVYVVLPPDTWIGAQSTANGGTIPNGTQRARALAEVTDLLIKQGKPVLVCLNPTTFPTYGATDPLADTLAPLGITLTSGDPILREQITGGRRVVTGSVKAVPSETNTNPVASSVAGLPISLSWTLGLETDERATPLIRLDADSASWAERDWLPLVRTPAPQRPLMPNPPSFDEGIDARGPWVIAAAAQRTLAGQDTPQRVIAIGANGWFLDPVWLARKGVDGRSVLSSPGNIELFESAISWLASQDELIAPSPSASPTPLVRPIDQATLSALRWGLVGGGPVLILLAGAVYHLRRRLS